MARPNPDGILSALDSVSCNRCNATTLCARMEDGAVVCLDPRPERMVLLRRRWPSAPQFAYEIPAYRYHRCPDDPLPD